MGPIIEAFLFILRWTWFIIVPLLLFLSYLAAGSLLQVGFLDDIHAGVFRTVVRTSPTMPMIWRGSSPSFRRIFPSASPFGHPVRAAPALITATAAFDAFSRSVNVRPAIKGIPTVRK